MIKLQKQRPQSEIDEIMRIARDSPFKFSCIMHAEYMLKKVNEIDRRNQLMTDKINQGLSANMNTLTVVEPPDDLV